MCKARAYKEQKKKENCQNKKLSCQWKVSRKAKMSKLKLLKVEAAKEIQANSKRYLGHIKKNPKSGYLTNIDVIAITGNLGPAPNCLSIWLNHNNDNTTAHRGKTKDAYENGCGKRNCHVQGETEGAKSSAIKEVQ